MPAFQDLTGRKFGRLTVIEQGEDSRAGVPRWVCKCDCGNTKEIVTSSIVRGVTTSCGCFQKEQAGRKTINLTGQRFGRLTVIERAENRANRTMWLCQCDCGTRKPVDSNSLRNGLSASCGCFQKEETRKRFTTHGARVGRKTSPEYSIWCNMMTRTTNENGERYADYGGRGISVCERWKSFELFLQDMGQRPSRNHSLERKDNDLGYFPENCYWATPTEQGRNKRNNIQIEYRGETKCLSEWSETLGIRYGTLYVRITQQSMTAEEAFNRPLGRWAK